MKMNTKRSGKSHFETLETRQLLAAAVSSTEILANLSSTNGVDLVKRFLQKNPKAGLQQYLSGKNKSLFNSGSTSTIQLTISKGKSVNRAIELLKKVASVNWVSPNYVYGSAKSEMTPNDPLLGNQLNQLNVIKAPQAWDTTTGSGVIIAVLDDGVDINHEDLVDNIWTNPGEIAGNNIDDDNNGLVDDVHGWDFANNDNNPSPDLNTTYNFIDPHGTLVAGVAAGVINNNKGVAGVAGGAKIMPVRFNGSQVTVTSASIASCIAYAANNGAKVINISFSIDPFQNDPAFFAATDLAYTKGCLWLNSAGNNNVENPPRVDITRALFVANTDNADIKYSNSNYGTGMDLSAPGVEDFGTVPGGYDSGVGTSFSTAMSSGTAALIFAAHPTWTRDQVAAQLVGTTDNIDALNPTYAGKLGSGRINALSAVTATLGAPKVRGLVGLSNNQVLTSAPTSFDLRTFNVLAASTVNASNFVLQYAGADNVFGAGDATIPLTLSATYSYGTNDIVLTPTAAMADGLYRFIAKSSITDPFGQALDGDSNGAGGDDYVVQFSLGVVNTINAPTGLTVATPSYSQTEAELVWNDNSNNETGFVIEVSSTSDFASITKTLTASANSTRYNDWGLSQGNTYYYRVKAVNAAGSSAYSNTAILNIPLPAAGVPNAPSNLTGTTSAYSQTEIVLAWTDNSSNETGFVIERSLSSGFATIEKTFNAVAGSNTYYDWGLTAGTTYFYRIKAVNGADSSTWSNTVNYLTPGGTVTAPAAPTTLAAGAVSGTPTSIALSWVDASNNETGFVLERSLTSTFAAITTINLAADATTYTDMGLALGTPYYYRIRAVNSAGPSANSNTATFTTPSLPTAPTTLAAAVVTGISTSTTLTWVDTSTTETSFALDRSTTSTFTTTTTTTITLAANATTYLDSGLTPGTAYFYRIRAVSAVGPSANSNTATFTPSLIPNAPSTLAAAGSPTVGTSIILTWVDNSANETSFALDRSTTSTFTGATTTTITVAANATTYTDTGRTLGTPYYYRIRAVNATGASINSNTATFTTPTTPAAPTTLAAAGAAGVGTSIVLTWVDASTNETSFAIDRSTSILFTSVTTLTAAANATTFTDTGLSFGTTYYYRIRSVNAVGSSANSNTATFTTPTLPAAPTTLSAVAVVGTATSIKLTWVDASSNETGFALDRSTTSTFTAATTTTTSIASNTTTYTDTGLAIGTQYYYRIRSVNAAGSSANSNTATFTTTSLPAAPTTLAVATVAGSSTSLALTWVDASNNETGLELDRSTSSTFATVTTISIAANATTYTDTGLTAATTYYYRIRSINLAGASANSNTATISTPAAPLLPTAPSGLAVGSNATVSTTADISWVDNSTNETGFELQRSTTNTFTAATTTTIARAANTTTYSDTGLTVGVVYFYRIRSINAAGGSSYSATATYINNSVNLSTSFNRIGIVNDGATFTGGGLDGSGYALSSVLMGTSKVINGQRYFFGTPGANSAVNTAGQTITLTQGNYTSLSFLATAVNGNKTAQVFTLRYSDGTTQTYTQSISDWFTPQNYAGETVAVANTYRNTSTGGRDARTFNVYSYTIPVNSAKRLTGITLPSATGVEIMAMNLSAMPTGVTAADIGAPALAGSSSYSNGVYTVSGGGTDIWNSADQFQFASTAASGNQTVTARLLSQTNSDPWAKAGVMFRSTSAANSAFVDVVQTPGNGLAMQWRDLAGNLQSISGPVVAGSVWVRINRAGNVFTGSYSTDGQTWTTIGTVTIAMPTATLAGLAVTSHSAAVLGTATFDNATLV